MGCLGTLKQHMTTAQRVNDKTYHEQSEHFHERSEYLTKPDSER